TRGVLHKNVVINCPHRPRPVHVNLVLSGIVTSGSDANSWADREIERAARSGYGTIRHPEGDASLVRRLHAGGLVVGDGSIGGAKRAARRSRVGEADEAEGAKQNRETKERAGDSRAQRKHTGAEGGLL